MQKLISLQHLRISSCSSLMYFPEAVIVHACPPALLLFPDNECSLLPKALTVLFIEQFQDIESLSKGLQLLTSLEKFYIRSCPDLQSLPKEGLPASLGVLGINQCPV
ncbi:hypothetical protein FEM48_Zijuj05G0026900 [Ziziphus jujuba var. spinosa]|uniref:Disease resistance protein At3g14460 n=1 Tax=Ziziphus jujuba var. spinosa TaxID=714518 RepID=A0A978VCC5_ZIZJJ|nr:hypothetical protein FEM48_Zijuj05G0026900 [Ziziphus jujuba var. spinosa]